MQEMSRDVGSIPGLGRSPGEGNGNHSSILAWEIHGQRSLAGYSPWGRKELGVTEGQNMHTWRVLHVGLTLDSLSLSHTYSHQYYSKTLLFISSSMSCGLNTIIKHLRLDDYIYILADQMYNENHSLEDPMQHYCFNITKESCNLTMMNNYFFKTGQHHLCWKAVDFWVREIFQQILNLRIWNKIVCLHLQVTNVLHLL